MPRPDSRTLDAHRPVEMIAGFHRMSEGSVLYRAGATVVLCVASIEDRVPPFLEGKGKGWITAEYQLHPRSNPPRRDSAAEVDLNVVATGRGGIVEIQGTAEGEPVPRKTIDTMVDLALIGVASLGKVQRAALTAASVDLDSLLVR